MRRPHDTPAGFALPMVILTMFVLVGAIAAGFAMISSERSSDDASVQVQSAAGLAETGLQQGLRNRLALGLPAVPPAPGDSVRVTLDGGYADVVTRLMRPGDLNAGISALYYVRSRGVRTRASSPGAGNAISMAAAFADFLPMTMTIRAAVTSLNGLDVNGGGNGYISGIDACSGESKAAVAVPTIPGYDQNSAVKTDFLRGTPKIQDIGATSEAAAIGIPFRWEDIVYRGAIQATLTVPSGGNPSVWPTSAAMESYPTVVVRNGPTGGIPLRLDKNQSGKGMLVIFGDLTINGVFTWDGVILIGGRLTLNGTPQIDGAISTGLNAKLDLPPPPNVFENADDLNGASIFQYNSCRVRSALTSLGALRAYQNTWANNFPAY